MARFDSLLHFTPLYQTRVWGGRRLETILRRALPDDQPYGESWDLVDRPLEQSIVANGPRAGTTLNALWTEARHPVFGAKHAASTAERFPLLIKTLDCRDDLSIQVHPPARVAPALGGEPKTEMWFVVHAEAGALVHAGLTRGVTRDDFEHALRTGDVAGCMHTLRAEAGDSLFVPSGRVHALGAGLLIYEIQQNSDTTYRVFDWNRLGLDGQPRTLHVEESLQCIDFDDVEPALHRTGGELASCEHFTVRRSATGDPAPEGDARIIVPIVETRWGRDTLAPGQLTLCPASLSLPEPDGEWLEISF